MRASPTPTSSTRRRPQGVDRAIDAHLSIRLSSLAGNPVYDAPAIWSSADKLASVPLKVHASLFFDETSEDALHFAAGTSLESWGDARAPEGR